MNQIVLSIDRMKHLEKLGLDTSDASMIWIHDDANGINTPVSEELCVNFGGKPDAYHTYFPAYTLQDILELILPLKLKDQEYFSVTCNGCTIIMRCSFEGDYEVKSFEGGMLDSAYNALLYCIENGYIKTKNV